ncbi:putative lipase [Nitzschia inconspicua]|uniref:Lipase n=1 Tax=Nitzschia inconspicua TaxID=303405 RepID=A0A9K3KIP1_9STRA|nr:putative lipase [Nitzschia inconspicua]
MGRKSTNPFDDDHIEPKDHPNENRSCRNSGLIRQQQHRRAPLNFSNTCDDVENPALSFDQSNRPARTSSADQNGLFISPLQSAMNEVTVNEYRASEQGLMENDDTVDELSALLPPGEELHRTSYNASSPRSGRSCRYRSSVPKEIKTGYDIRQNSLPQHQEARKRSTKTKNTSNIVMTELGIVDGDNEVMEYKYILLEDLGTASSWFILLLPYITFALSMLLEYATPLSVSTIGPIQATMLCDVEKIYEVMHRLPVESELAVSNGHGTTSCYASFAMKSSFDQRNVGTSWSGTMFDSGSLGNMPVIGTNLYGAAMFSNLSTDAVAMIAQGRVRASVVILEETPMESYKEQEIWKPMFVSTSSSLSMTCESSGYDDNDAQFVCKTPDLISMAFSMPETAVYTGGNVRFLVFYEHASSDVVGSRFNNKSRFGALRTNATITTTKSPVSNRTIDERGEQYRSSVMILTERAVENPSLVLEEMVSSSSYTIRYRSTTTVLLDTIMRILCFIFSIGFFFFWCRQMGIQCCPSSRRMFSGLLGWGVLDEVAETYWWENPWVLIPERYYIVLLLISLLLMQEPFLVIIYFLPYARSNHMHMLADAAMGIGVQGILLVYLCLFEGLKFHTADRSKRRAERQRQALQLRRAVKLVGGCDNDLSSPVAVDNFYREFGDTDGSALTSHLRLPNDPFGDGWADFLIPKMFLWVVGVVSVSVTSYCRFCEGQDLSGNGIANSLTSGYTNVDIVYITFSIVQVFTILIWVYLIVVALSVSGEALKHEPFLATRPAQLSYRVLFAHTALLVTALLVSFALYLRHLQNDWHGQAIELSVAQQEKSVIGLCIDALHSYIARFPYSGTSATVGFGRLLCVTVEVLITAFIFLPAHSMDIDDVDDEIIEDMRAVELRNYRKNKRDKRTVVQLAKESKTWRIFPCPIQRLESHAFPLQDSMYQLYKDLHTDRNMRLRGLVSIGTYTPVFCNEVACWLNEASWQAYYTPPGSPHMTEKDDFIGWMNLDALGLRLEGYVYDERTNAQALIATNAVPQVDGEEDSIVVVAFRGTSNVAHMQIDIRMRQAPIMEQLMGVAGAAIRILPDQVDIDDKDGWFWDTVREQYDDSGHVKCVACWNGAEAPHIPPTPTTCHERNASASSTFEQTVAKGAKDLLKITPVAKNTFPMIHEGFQDAYNQIRKQIFDLLVPVLHRQVAKAATASSTSVASSEPLALPKIYCTGHSLGGSLAQIFALDLASNCEFGFRSLSRGDLAAQQNDRPDDLIIASTVASTTAQKKEQIRYLQPPIAVYTFGQPRVGNKAFAKLYKQRVPHTFRVVNEGDAITAIPNYLCCGGVYKHAGLEVILDQGMTGNILVGPTVVETLFRFNKVRTKIAAHQMAKYRDCLECAFDPSQLLEYYKGHNVAHQELQNADEPGEKEHSLDATGYHRQIAANNLAAASFIPEWMIAPRKAA